LQGNINVPSSPYRIRLLQPSSWSCSVRMERSLGGTSKKVQRQPYHRRCCRSRVDCLLCGERKCGVSIMQVSLPKSLTTPSCRLLSSSESECKDGPREYFAICDFSTEFSCEGRCRSRALSKRCFSVTLWLWQGARAIAIRRVPPSSSG
jgi:hypothetical protein